MQECAVGAGLSNPNRPFGLPGVALIAPPTAPSNAFRNEVLHGPFPTRSAKPSDLAVQPPPRARPCQWAQAAFILLFTVNMFLLNKAKLALAKG